MTLGRAGVIAAMAAAACGRLGFGEVRPPDGARPWEGEFTLSAPELVAELNTAAGETECFVLSDGRTLLFTSTRGGGDGGHDIYRAERPGPGAPFGAAVHLAEISTSAAEGHLATSDGLTGYLWSDRPGGLGSADIWEVTRAALDAPFDDANAVNPVPLNTPQEEYDPWPSADGLRLYYARRGDLVVAERASPGGAFGAPVTLAGPDLATADQEDNPALSADELFLVFSSTRAEGLGGRDIYYARREDRRAPFSRPQLLPIVNGPYADWEACITEDGELFFSSDRPGGKGGDDLYRARFEPLP